MSMPTQEEQRPSRFGGKGRPAAFLIAAIIGLGGLGVATGMALGSVGSMGAASPSPASADYDCPGRAGYGGPDRGPGPRQPGTP
jgi:hypothetical protein